MQKYEREIEELLERLESQAPESPRPIRRDRPPNLPRRRSPFTSSLRQAISAGVRSPAYFMPTGLGLVILSWILPNSTLQEWVAVIGVLLFLWPIVANIFDRNRPGPRQKTWRGRSLDPEEKSWNEIRDHLGSAARDFRRRFRRRY